MSNFVPVWLVELGGAIVALIVLIGLVFKMRRWLRIINPLRITGKKRFGMALVKTLKTSLVQSDVITDSRLRLVMHQFVFWGFIFCGVATTLVWVTGTAEKARTFTEVPKIFGNVGGVLLLIGVSYLLLRLVVLSEFRRNRRLGDLVFFISLFIVAVTGFTTQFYRMEGSTLLALSNYYIHLAANFVLLAAAPFTHFIHAITTPLMRLLATLYPERSLYKEKYDKIGDEVARFFEEDKKA